MACSLWIVILGYRISYHDIIIYCWTIYGINIYAVTIPKEKTCIYRGSCFIWNSFTFLYLTSLFQYWINVRPAAFFSPDNVKRASFKYSTGELCHSFPCFCLVTGQVRVCSRGKFGLFESSALSLVRTTIKYLNSGINGTFASVGHFRHA